MLKRICLSLAVMVFATLVCRAEVLLTGDTSEPVHSTFIPGQEILLKFRIIGLPPVTDEVLSVSVVDEHGEAVKDFRFPLVAATNDEGRVRYSDDNQNSNFLWKVDVRVPTNRLGFFQAIARLSDGTELQPLVRRGKYLTYAIVPDPFLRVRYPKKDTFFGIMCARGETAPLMGASVDILGYAAVNWMDQEPDRPGQFKEALAAASNRPWEVVSPMTSIETYHIAGRKIEWPKYRYRFVYRPPYWAARNETRSHQTAALTPEGERAWRDYAEALAEAYATIYPEEEVQHFEMTTEPDPGWGFKGTMEDLVRIHEIAYEAFHAKNPRAMVGGPTYGGIGAGEDWGMVEHTRKAFEAGIGKYIDVLHMHPYLDHPEKAQFIQKIRTIKKIMRDSVGREIPMAGTEAGYAYTGETRANWLDKAWSDVRANLIMLGEGFLFNNAFYGDDGTRNPDAGAWGYYINLDPNRDYGPEKMCPKPVVPAYSTMSFLLEGHKTAGAIEWLGDTAWGYAYESDSGDIVLAVWDWSGASREVEIPVGSESVQVYDWMGNRTEMPSEKGVLRLTLMRDPQYITGVAPTLWSREAMKPVTLKQSQIDSYPGRTLRLDATVTGGTGIEGTLVQRANAGLGVQEQIKPINLKSGESMDATFEISIPATTSPGMYPIPLLLESAGVTKAAVGCVIQVLAPANIVAVRPALTGSKAGVCVRLKGNMKVSGQLQVDIPALGGWKSEMAVELGEAEERDFVLSFGDQAPAPTRLYDVTTVMTTSEASRQENTRSLSFIGAAAAKTAITIDGDLSDWSNAMPVALSAPEALRVPPSLVKVPDDLAATVRLAWDSSALYLSFDVTDDVFLQTKDGWATWMEDCIQIGLNMDPDKVFAGAAATIEAGGMRRWQDIDIAETPKGPEVYRTMTFDQRFCAAGLLSNEAASLSVKREGNRTTYEMALPWKSLNVDQVPKAGDCIGFACTINDMDPDSSTRLEDRGLLILGLFNGITGGKDIGKFGWVVLSE